MVKYNPGSLIDSFFFSDYFYDTQLDSAKIIFITIHSISPLKKCVKESFFNRLSNVCPDAYH